MSTCLLPSLPVPHHPPVTLPTVAGCSRCAIAVPLLIPACAVLSSLAPVTYDEHATRERPTRLRVPVPDLYDHRHPRPPCRTALRRSAAPAATRRASHQRPGGRGWPPATPSPAQATRGAGAASRRG